MRHFGDFESDQDICDMFDINQDTLSGVEVLLAAYGCEDYDGFAFVLFQSGDKLFEVNGGHCSCYGLEGQWEPEETSWQALQFRLENGRNYGYSYGTPEALTALRDLVREATSG